MFTNTSNARDQHSESEKFFLVSFFRLRIFAHFWDLGNVGAGFRRMAGGPPLIDWLRSKRAVFDCRPERSHGGKTKTSEFVAGDVVASRWIDFGPALGFIRLLDEETYSSRCSLKTGVIPSGKLGLIIFSTFYEQAATLFFTFIRVSDWYPAISTTHWPIDFTWTSFPHFFALS